MSPVHNLSKITATITIMFAAQTHPALAANCKIVDMLEAHATEKIEATEATCSRFLSQSNSTGISCYWEFPFRDQSATQMAKSFWGDIQNCRRGNELEADLQVNHPDSYDLREWVTTDGIFRVSVKDKTQLEKTLVFLRFEKSN